jgi:hypothetical protein
MTSFLKKLGLTNPDGTPNDIYRKFRNPSSSGGAIAQSIRRAYAPLYVRNEYAHKLDENDLLGLVVEETGEAHDSNSVRLIVSCFKHLKGHANFDEHTMKEEPTAELNSPAIRQVQNAEPPAPRSSIGLNLGYTINLNLPATSDPAVFDAIFKSLKQNLLSGDDA